MLLGGHVSEGLIRWVMGEQDLHQRLRPFRPVNIVELL